MENNNNGEMNNNAKKHGPMCDCGNCWGGGMHHHAMGRRMFLMILVIVLAFWCGMKLGEIKGELGMDRYSGYRGHSMLRDYGYQTNMMPPATVQVQTAPQQQ